MLLVLRFPRYQLMLHNDREQQGWSKAVKQFQSCTTLLRILVGGLRGISSTKSWNARLETALPSLRYVGRSLCAVSLRTHDGKNFCTSMMEKGTGDTNSAGNLRKKRRHELTDMTISDGTLRTNSGTWTLTCFFGNRRDMLLYLAILEYGCSKEWCTRNPINDFFACLLGEFQDKLWKKKKMRMYGRKGRRIVASDLLNDYSADAQRLSSTIIPFLAPPNAEWPSGISTKTLTGAILSTCFVPALKNGVMSTLKTRESRMKNRFSSASAIVFVFRMKLARFRKPWGHRSVSCVKIHYRDGGVKWIFQQPKNRDRKQLFIVYETTGNGVKRMTTNSLIAFNTKAVALF
ncbi:hypothetical protein Plhal703r1_c06g0031331 [Plasmopara halstedii]